MARKFIRCFIGLGSNLQEPLEQIRRASNALGQLEDCRLLSVSPLYASKPMGPQNQPDYVNGVAELGTLLTARALLDQLQIIENQHNRVRSGERWGARTLDLDLLLYGQQQIQEPGLTVPHVGIAQRNFVLFPLADLVGENFDMPVHGRLAGLLLRCGKSGLKKI